jgi:hypothetical protein
VGYPWFEALRSAGGGDSQSLVIMLKNGHPKTDDERKLLAAFFEGKFKKRRGRQPDEAVAIAASVVKTVKRGFREQGIRIRLGHFHDAAIACACDFLREKGLALPDLNKLENHLRRSQKPRK